MELSEFSPRRRERGNEGAVQSSGKIVRNLYLAELLASWAIRTSEYSTALFLAACFPGTLFYVSLYGVTKSLAAALLSSWVGAQMDRAERLSAMRTAIACQRLAVAASCLIFLLMPFARRSIVLFCLLLLLACVEKLASVANIVALERDWVIGISSALNKPRQDLNAVLRRLDLGTKLVAPFIVSCLDTYWHRSAITLVLATNVVSIAVEFSVISKLYFAVPGMSRRAEHHETPIETSHLEPDKGTLFRRFLMPWIEYVRSAVFLPSFSNALLYFTVLSFGGQMVTYLLASGFSPLLIGFLRVLSVVAELGGTWAAPLLMRKIGPVRAGLWFMNWQSTVIGIAVTLIVNSDNAQRTIGTCLIVAICLKRLALWGSDLCVQFIVQDGTPPASRSRFSATEMACQSLFEVLSSASTIVFARPDQFKYPIYLSYSAVAFSTFCYALFVRKIRGHLIHMDTQIKLPVSI